MHNLLLANHTFICNKEYKAEQTEFAVYRHRPHGFSQKFSDFMFNTVNIWLFEPHPLIVLIRGQGLCDFEIRT